MSLCRSTCWPTSARCPAPLAPPPTIVAGRRIVAPDVERVDANLQFDVTDETATGEATVYFDAGELTGHPVLDLRQPIDWLRLDGDDLDPDTFAPMDLGGGPGAEMRVLDVPWKAAPATTQLGYRLETPQAGEPSRSAGTGAGSALTCGCPTSSLAATWRCGHRPRSSMTSSPSTSGSPDRPRPPAYRGGQHCRCRRRSERGEAGAVLPRPFHRPLADAGPGSERRGRTTA